MVSGAVMPRPSGRLRSEQRRQARPGPGHRLVVGPELGADDVVRASGDDLVQPGPHRGLVADDGHVGRPVEALAVVPRYALVDGNYPFRLPCEVKTVVGGDAKSRSIAAASILAKVARDRLMVELDGLYPGYGFASHKGYRAPVHAEALLTLGPCEIHRMAWGPVKLALLGKDPLLAFGDALQDELPFEAAE